MTGRVQKSRIEIPMPSKPRPYRPGDGPALTPITLALKNDGDAFIIDKRVQPGKPVRGEVKLEMYYVVGWPDLPAGRVVINAREIYDYVSPRTLEDFEYKLSLAREEEEKRRQEVERVKRKAEAAARAQTAAKAKVEAVASASSMPSSSASATPKIGTPRPAKAPTLAAATPGKKRGRPSKADMLARQMAQQTSVDENTEVSLPPASTSGPSLSTPQKKKKFAAPVATASEVDTDDQEEEDEEAEVEEEDEEDVHFEEDLDTGDAIFQQLYSEASAVNTAKKASDAKPPEKEMPLRTAPKIPSPLKPADVKPKHSTPSQPRLQLQTNQNRSPSGPKTAPVQRTTLQHYGFTPAGRSSGKWPSPGTQPSDTKAAVVKAEEAGSTSTNTNTTTVAAAAAAAVETPTTTTTNSAKKPPRKRKRTTSTPKSSDPLWEVKKLEDDRVEESDDGTRTRFFRVRWKGHWPSDQNPTWEPEENIPRKLIKDYLRLKAIDSSYNNQGGGGGGGGGSSSARNTPSVVGVGVRAETPSSLKSRVNRRPALPAKKYSSVSEVFEGAVDEESGVELSKAGSTARGGRVDALAYGDDGEDDDYDEGDVDQLVVTEQPPPPRRQQQQQRREKQNQQNPGGSAPPLPLTPALSLSSLLRGQVNPALSRELVATFGGPRAIDRRLSQHQQPQQEQQLHSESSDP